MPVVFATTFAEGLGARPALVFGVARGSLGVLGFEGPNLILGVALEGVGVARGGLLAEPKPAPPILSFSPCPPSLRVNGGFDIEAVLGVSGKLQSSVRDMISGERFPQVFQKSHYFILKIGAIFSGAEEERWHHCVVVNE